MAYKDNISRLSRLTAILLKLQSHSYIPIERLVEAFNVSERTIYRDLTSLEQAGVPIIHVEGRGYTLVDGYIMQPVTFTETEANAIIFGEKLIDKTKDESLINEFKKATDKIRSVLRSEEKEKAEFLAKRTIIGKNWDNERSSSYLSKIQKALTNFQLLEIEYRTEDAMYTSTRDVEPFAIYHNTSENWMMIAWCRLKNDFRSFRIDRIRSLKTLREKFEPHKTTLEEYVETQRKLHSKKSD